MQLDLGRKIRELRHRDGRTQEALAESVGVTPQAVSRWEANGCYPDMEMIPAIANYFGITIDELFGYDNDRESRIAEIIRKIEGFSIPSRSDDGWVDECLTILREGIAEFPQNERLLIALADTLTEAGWRRYKEEVYYDSEGFLCGKTERHSNNEFWAEAIKICERLLQDAKDSETVTKATRILVLLYRNTGETEKAIACAETMPEMKNCREIMLSFATDGRERAKKIGDLLLLTAREFSHQLVYALLADKTHFESDLPIEKIKGAIALYNLICDDGNFGNRHGDLVELYLFLSCVQWMRGYHDESFVSLNKSLEHAKALETVCDGSERTFTAPLLSLVSFRKERSEGITKNLPDDWPWWSCPVFSQAEREIKSDPRWAEWVKKTRE